MKLLIAEDDSHTRRALADTLQREGYTVQACANGREALALCQKDAPDLICLDLMMPEVSGYEVCKRLRSGGSHVPIIFITAKSEEADKILGFELGADDYVVKPFGVREVVARIRAVLRRSGALQKAAGLKDDFAMDDLRVSPAELRATRNGAEVSLSLRDVRILQLLCERRGRVVTRDLLFQIAWGMNYLPNSRSIDQHISQLRKRVEVNPLEPVLIKTVHGVGYRFD